MGDPAPKGLHIFLREPDEHRHRLELSGRRLLRQRAPQQHHLLPPGSERHETRRLLHPKPDLQLDVSVGQRWNTLADQNQEFFDRGPVP